MPGLNIATILSYVLAVAVGVLIYFVYAKLNISKANVSAQKIIDDATSKADNLVKEAILDAKTQAYELKLEAEKEIKEQKQEITELENNLSEREKGIERRNPHHNYEVLWKQPESQRGCAEAVYPPKYVDLPAG